MLFVLCRWQKDELSEKYKALEWGNVETEKELVVLRVKTEFVNSLQEEIHQYYRLFTLVAQITKLAASLANSEELRKKSSQEVVEVCQVFEADQKVLQ